MTDTGVKIGDFSASPTPTPTLIPTIGTPTPCPTSDTNNDCRVDAQDARSLLQEWLSRVANNLDFNQDGKINVSDFFLIFNEWGG